jgi:hypothetical protein
VAAASGRVLPSPLSNGNGGAKPPRTSEEALDGWLDQRERERERRVSDADASYNGPINSAKTLNNAIPQRKQAKNNPLSKNVTRSLSQGTRQKRLKSTTQGPNPNLTLCYVPYPTGKPD